MKVHTYRRAGFTLIELIVTVSIILLLVLGAMANYFEFDSKQKMLSEVRNLVAFIDKARSKAMAQEYPVGCVGLVSYGVRSADFGVMEIVANCGSGASVPEQEKILITTKLSSPLSIDFLVPSGKTINGENVLITLEDNNNPSVFKTILIDARLIDKTILGP